MHSCYRLGYAEALAPTSNKKPIPCTQAHTAVTFYVGTFDPQLPVDGAQVHRLESTVCPRQFATYVGGTLDERRLSMLRAVWFTPTLAQAARGAHWFECTAIALRGDQTLALMSGPVQGVLESSDGRDHYALCGTAEPGSAGFEQRICAAPHSWKALRTVAFTPGRYPGPGPRQLSGADTLPGRRPGRRQQPAELPVVLPVAEPPAMEGRPDLRRLLGPRLAEVALSAAEVGLLRAQRKFRRKWQFRPSK